MATTSCAAIDLGASNGRVVVAELDGDRIRLREAHRFDTPLVQDPSGYQCWDVDTIEAGVREGLRAAESLAPLASVGVDTWGVDFALVDDGGARVAPVVSYRDGRTQAAMAQVVDQLSAAELYRRTGIQLQPFNSLFQLAATAAREPAWLSRARRLLLLPDYFHLRLCGARANEYTDATTTQLWSIQADDWDDRLLAAAGIGRGLLGRPVEPGTALGALALPGGARVQVIAPATHDTASSVAAIPLEGSDTAYISSGTWSLMGIESRVPLAGEAALRQNVTNEGGVERRFRVLKNIVGLWLTQRIRQELGGEDHLALMHAAEAAAPWRSLVDPEDLRFYNPPSMIEAIRGFCAETGQQVPEGAGALARCAFESLALCYRRTAAGLAALRGRPLARVHIVGGGSQNRLLDQLCADACQLPVRAGPVETAALGNACVQLIALGALPSLDAARALIRRSFQVEEYAPGAAVPAEALQRFAAFGEARALRQAQGERAQRAKEGET
jgi:rhamnulokinase